MKTYLKLDIPLEPSDSRVRDACLSYRHDYGLLEPKEQLKVEYEARAWYEAWRKSLTEPSYLYPSTTEDTVCN